MQKKTFILLTLVSALSVGVTLVVATPLHNSFLLKGDSFSMTLDSTSEVETKDEGYLHQITNKNNKFDMIGWTSVSGKLGSIKKATYGAYQYSGMIYNRSVINGFSELTVNFDSTQGDLYYLFTDFLMENMDFNGNQLTSGSPVSANGKAYFLIYNPSTTPVDINSIKIDYSCDASVDDSMIFNKTSTLGGARSYAKSTILDDSFVTLENNPTKTTNNYSTGSHNGHADTWYRWNGRYFANSDVLGTNFSFGMTIIGNISQMVDESKYFHYAVWPQFGFYNSEHEFQTSDGNYVQTYIGNDNYEPLGKDAALHPSDPYVKESYTGRFFTDYGWYKDENDNYGWRFADPDLNFIDDGVTTFREAYEAYDLPFWFLKFDVRLENDLPVCDVSINGFKLFTQEIFADPDDNPYGELAYDKVNKPGLVIHSLPMHLVNYGVDADGNPGNSYTGTFTYPRLAA